MAQVVVSIDTSGDTLKVTFASASKEGVTGSEKALTARAVDAMGRDPNMPKIVKIASTDSSREAR